MTQQQTDRQDRLVEDYLGAVSYACGDLSPQRRDELVEDLREHIAAARGVLYEPTEAALRTILDRLGEPAVIAEEARAAEGLSQSAAVSQPVPRQVTGLPAATLGMWLGFVLMVIIVLVLGALLMMSEPPPPAP